MYADFISYNARKAVVWGGHSGDLTKFEEFYPVLRKPLGYFVDRYGLDYLILDHAYVSPDRLGITESVTMLERHGSIGLYEFVRRPLPTSPDVIRR